MLKPTLATAQTRVALAAPLAASDLCWGKK
jgi:hypothetical protein